MKYYIDRKRLGISEIFSGMHPIFSPSNDMTAEETIRLMCEQSHSTRSKIAAGINRAIGKMTRDSTVDVDEYLNDDIRDLVEQPVRADTLASLLPLMRWLMELHRVNSLDVERSQYSLNDAANHMEREAGEFLRSCSTNMMWQHISIVQEKNGLLMTLNERFWGKAGLFFPDVSTSFEGTFPLVGMLFCIEAEQSNGEFEFSFMVNVEFGTDDMELRALQNRNWVRLTFKCACPELRLSLFDYGAYLRDFGKCGHGFIEDWCGEVISKEQTLGSASMSVREQELLPLAKLFRITYQMADIEDPEKYEHSHGEIAIPGKALELLGNRYRFAMYKDYFEKKGQQELYEILGKAAEAWGEDEIDSVASYLWKFAGLLREKERNDSIRELYGCLIAKMLDCTSEFGDVSRIYGTYSEAEEKMRAIIEPKLMESGFTGSYPHYRRLKKRGKKGEYISVLTSNVNRRTVNGVMTYYFSISAAVKRLEKRGKGKKAVYYAGGIPFENTTAEECSRVYDRHTKYCELGGIYDDESAEINIDVFDGLSEENQAEDTAMVLLKFVNVALDGFKGKAMPRWYSKKRRKSSVKYVNETTTGGTFMKFLPFGLYISALLMGVYVVCERFFDLESLKNQIFIPEARTALVLSLLVGTLIALVCSLLRMRSLRRHIWRY